MSATINYNSTTKIKFRDNKAKIIVEDKYQLSIILYKNEVVAKYNNYNINIEFEKFNTEEIAKKIYSLVRKTGKFNIEVIEEVLQNLKIGDFCGKFAEKLFNMSFSEADKIIEDFEKILNRV